MTHKGSEKVIQLPSVANGREGIAAEQRWTEENFPNSKWLRQRTFLNEQGQVIDEITLCTASGTEVPVYFDISSWYGSAAVEPSKNDADTGDDTHTRLNGGSKASEDKAKGT
jgi:hypothetical protein